MRNYAVEHFPTRCAAASPTVAGASRAGRIFRTSARPTTSARLALPVGDRRSARPGWLLSSTVRQLRALDLPQQELTDLMFSFEFLGGASAAARRAGCRDGGGTRCRGGARGAGDAGHGAPRNGLLRGQEARGRRPLRAPTRAHFRRRGADPSQRRLDGRDQSAHPSTAQRLEVQDPASLGALVQLQRRQLLGSDFTGERDAVRERADRSKVHRRAQTLLHTPQLMVPSGGR